MGMTPKLTLPPATGRSRPATGMSQKENMGGAEVWRDSGEQGVTDSARHREEQEWQLEVSALPCWEALGSCWGCLLCDRASKG